MSALRASPYNTSSNRLYYKTTNSNPSTILDKFTERMSKMFRAGEDKDIYFQIRVEFSIFP